MSRAVFHNGTCPPCPAPFNMAQYVLQAGANTPQKPALVIAGTPSRTFSFADIESAVRGFGAGLLARGLTPGDKMLMRLGNTADFPICYLGAIAVGIVPVPTSSMLTEPEVARIIDELDPALILHEPDVPCPDDARTIGPDEIARLQTMPPASWNMGAPDRLAYIVYTSGTSGTPRAVCHAHRAIWARRMMHDGWYGIGPDDRMLHAGAFNWTFTLGTGVMDPWSVGATSIVAAPGTPLDALPDLMRTHRATIFAAAPGVFRKLLDGSNSHDLPDLRHALTAGEKMSPRIAERWQSATGTPVFEAYGQSEISTFISSSPNAPCAPDTLGRPQPGRHVAILDDEGTPVGFGDPGTIAIHRADPGLMIGYLGEPPTAAGPDWYATGDQGVMEPDGQIRFLGRRDDMMNAGGYRVSPLEVEAAFSTHPGIDSIGVTEIEVKADTRIIVAFYTGATALDDADLRAHAATTLASYKRPRAFVHIPEMPVNANGKLLRAFLRQFWSPPQ